MINARKWFCHNYLVYLLLILCQSSSADDDTLKVTNPDPTRFQNAIDIFIQWDKKNTYPENSVLFVGSSSIRFWDTRIFFPDYPVINRGFGGSHISDVNYFYQRTVSIYKPKIIVFYAGDNDIAYNKSEEQVINDFKHFVYLVKTDLPECKIIYLPIKPSLDRWEFWERMKIVNTEVQKYCGSENMLYYVDTATPMLDKDTLPDSSLFIRDGLHLNKKGYRLWTDILLPVLDQLYH